MAFMPLEDFHLRSVCYFTVVTENTEKSTAYTEHTGHAVVGNLP